MFLNNHSKTIKVKECNQLSNLKGNRILKSYQLNQDVSNLVDLVKLCQMHKRWISILQSRE